jgi:hypothetical protein
MPRVRYVPHPGSGCWNLPDSRNNGSEASVVVLDRNIFAAGNCYRPRCIPFSCGPEDFTFARVVFIAGSVRTGGRQCHKFAALQRLLALLDEETRIHLKTVPRFTQWFGDEKLSTFQGLTARQVVQEGRVEDLARYLSTIMEGFLG